MSCILRCVAISVWLLSASTLVGCVTVPPAKPIDKEKLSAIRSIGIAIPKQTAVSAFVGAAPTANYVNNSTTGAIMSGAIGGFLTGYSQSRAAGFDALVKQRFPTLNFGQVLADALSRELSGSGYRVVTYVPEIDENLAKKPATPEDLLKMKPNDVNVDAVLILAPHTSYQAPGPLNSYTRYVMLNFSLIDVPSKTIVLDRGFTYRKHFSDDYSYNTYASLSDNLPEAIDGLHKALLDFVPLVSASIEKP